MGHSSEVKTQICTFLTVLILGNTLGAKLTGPTGMRTTMLKVKNLGRSLMEIQINLMCLKSKSGKCGKLSCFLQSNCTNLIFSEIYFKIQSSIYFL
jgi:hypothetical protein